MTTAHPLSPGPRETSVAKNVLWPLPGPCELVPTYTCLFFLFCFVFGGGSNRPRGAGQMWEIDVFGKDFKEMLGGGDIQNLEDSEVSESQVCKTGSPSPRGLQRVPFPGRGLPWSPSRRACCQALRKVAHPPPGCTSSSLPPAPADAAVHTQYLLLFSLPVSPLPSPWEESAGWQIGRNLLSPLWVPVSPPYLRPDSLCQGQATQGLGTTIQGCLSP